MSAPAPHFHLFSAGHPADSVDPVGRWRFVLRTADGRACLEATDEEVETSAERLQLLAIVRGLEALDEPAQVTLRGASRSIRLGLRHGLELWRENGWQWERFGKWTPVKNRDLWQRIDRAMAIHKIECRELDDITRDDLAPPPASSDELPEVRAEKKLAHASDSPPIVRRRRANKSGMALRFDPAPAQQLHPDCAEGRPVSRAGWLAWLASWGIPLRRFVAPAKWSVRSARPPSQNARRTGRRRPKKIHSALK
jgi:ribonuclease HI